MGSKNIKNFSVSVSGEVTASYLPNPLLIADIVINTSCEHITQEQYEQWLDNQPDDALFVIQSNNYFELEEHIRCSVDLDDFVRMSNIASIFKGVYETPKYDRFMIIGRKNV